MALTRTRFHAAAAAGVFGIVWNMYLNRNLEGWPFGLARLMYGDRGAHIAGWMLYRNAPWAFPLGTNYAEMHPIGTSLGYTDSLPLLGVFFKLLSPALPHDFQYISLYVVVCYALQGWFGAKLAGLSVRSSFGQALCGCFFVTAPTLAQRQMHPALCSHWVILALLHLNLVPISTRKARFKAVRDATLLCIFSAGTHPYIAAIALPLAAAVPTRFFVASTIGISQLLIFEGLIALATAGTGYVFGYFARDVVPTSGGFGMFAANLNTFLAPNGLVSYSRILPALPTSGREYEGFAYLGIGFLAMCPFLVARIAQRPALRFDIWPGLIVTASLAIYAFGSQVRLNAMELADLSGLYNYLRPITSLIRSGGRCIWPLHYLLCFSLLAAIWQVAGRSGIAVYVTLLCLQVFDTSATPLPFERAPAVYQEIDATAWQQYRSRFRHIALFPAQIYGGNCPGQYNENVVLPMSHLASRLGMTLNSGYTSRLSRKVHRYCARTLPDAALRLTSMDTATLYVTNEANAQSFRSIGAACEQQASFFVCHR